jgi:acyl carrier protein
MSDELIQRVLKVIAASKRIPLETVTIDSEFVQLTIDSMDAVEILFALENEFDINIPDDDVRSVRNVRQMCEGVDKLVAAKNAGAQAGRLRHAARPSPSGRDQRARPVCPEFAEALRRGAAESVRSNPRIAPSCVSRTAPEVKGYSHQPLLRRPPRRFRRTASPIRGHRGARSRGEFRVV